MVMVVKYKEDCEPEYDNTKDKEEPEEILHIVSEVGSIVFFVPLPNPFAFIIEHFIDLTNMLLHLTCHPLVFLVEHILNPLPVSIIDLDRNLQLGWGFLQNIIDVLVDGIYLTADSVNGIAKGSLG